MVCHFSCVGINCRYGGGGYWLWPQWQSLQQQSQLTEQAIEQKLQQTTATISQQQQQWLEVQKQKQLRLQQEYQQAMQQDREQLQMQIQSLRQQVQQRDGAPPQHWVLMEVRFLLKRASQSLVLQQDVQSARWLLQAADEQLAKLDNVLLLIVRQAIKDDLAALQQVPKTDFSPLYLQLGQLRRQSMQLPLKQQEHRLIPSHQPNDDLGNWRENLSSYWEQVSGKLFNVRAAQPQDFFSLSSEQQITVRLSLQQQLLLAELAILQQEPEVYQHALQQAADLLQRYFAAEDPIVQQTSASIVELASAAMQKPALPTLQSINQLDRQLSIITEANYE
ncbi:uroporphyrinogen-III C-methyltransferase [Alishewanella sp. HL-SH05]|uniref:uroporphyrinogen-III C-methyltransferase n=1 Tax=Alishewanella sp. HL-SH05 TaxID=3461145 RepID=UPI004043652F